MAEGQRVGEVVEACTTGFVAQCYELYQSPPLGGLVKTRGDSEKEYIFGVVYNVLTSGIEPGRRPIARGKDELNEEEIFRASPQLLKLLKSEFSVLVVGYRYENRVFQYLPPRTARIHSFVYLCTDEEIRNFSHSFDFLSILLKARLDTPVEDLIGASLREIGKVHGGQRHDYLVSAGKELAALLCDDYGQLKTILKGLKCDAAE